MSRAAEGAEERERVTRLSERIVRVLAPNPSPMTLEGTNTYLVGAPGGGSLVVIDPGPDDPAHADRTLAAASGAVELVLLTHGHVDHAEGAAAFAALAGAPIAAVDPRLASSEATVLRDGAVLEAGGVGLTAVLTPGHAADHACFLLPDEQALFTGDHILGRGTTMVEWPGGDMTAYLASLERVVTVRARRLYPGHGPVVDEPGATVAHYIAHRQEREAQVLTALAAGDRRPSEIVRRVYRDVDPALHPAAELSVRAHLARLVSKGRVATAGDGYRPR